MSDRLIPVLSISCGALTLSYLFLMITTIFFASYQTEALNSVRNNESIIATLESTYYSDTNRINSLDPSTLGYVMPSNVQYVAESNNAGSNLTFNGN